MSARARKRIKRYLQTGVIHDVNMLSYNIINGEFRGSCPFCDLPNDAEFPMHVSDNNGGSITVCLCSNCNEVITELPSVAKETNLRLRQYLHKNVLPHDADSYAEGQELEEHCVFCNQEFGTFHNREYHSIPIEQGKYPLLHNFVKCCSACGEVIDEFMDLNEQWHDSREDTRMDVVYDNCIRCGIDYPITMPEKVKRITNKTTNKHHCNDCLKSVYMLEGVPRFIVNNCPITGCKNHVGIDRTLFPTVQLQPCKFHSETDPEEYRIEFVEGTGNDFLVEIIQVDADQWSLRIYNNHGDLEESLPKSNDDLLYESKQYFSDSTYAAYVAGEVIEKLIEKANKNQMTFFE